MTTHLDALLDEHRSIAAVLHAMRYLVRAKRDTGMKIDPQVFGAMLYYLDVFPERMHHPKEEAVFFDVLRQRTHEADGVLEELGREHKSGEDAIRVMEQALLRYTQGGEREFADFAEKTEQYIEGYLQHIRKEEEIVIPCARRALTTEDWKRVEVAFAGNRDPLKGADPADYRKLFTRIVNLAPPPVGLG